LNEAVSKIEVLKQPQQAIKDKEKENGEEKIFGRRSM
jgi:hypothetical protein